MKMCCEYYNYYGDPFLLDSGDALELSPSDTLQTQKTDIRRSL